MTRGSELEQLRHKGKRVRSASIDARATASLHAFGRVGFIVPRYKHSAVQRNKLKRRLRELVRVEMLPQLPALDVVIRAAPRAYNLPFAELRAEVRFLSERLGKL